MPAASPTTAAPPRLRFAVLGAAPLDHAAAPAVRIGVEVASDRPVRSILLDCQVQIAARRRAHEGDDTVRLTELFGHESAWGTTLRTLLWARVTRVVPAFAERIVVDVDLPCSYDHVVAASRYLDALRGGTVPLELLFSGSVFYAGEGGALQTTRISWEQEADFRLPVGVWREALDRHFPGAGWLRVDRDTYERLCAFKAARALPTWEAAMAALLDEAGER
jgi:hypothetical protein